MQSNCITILSQPGDFLPVSHCGMEIYMAEEIIITGKTFEEAMAQAQSEYSGENVQYEILEMPKKGIFGIGASPAKIKVIIYQRAKGYHQQRRRRQHSCSGNSSGTKEAGTKKGKAQSSRSCKTCKG